jgi:hypothetical protein
MSEQHESGINKYNPSKDEWIEILEALKGEVRDGRLVAIVFALQDKRVDKTMVEHFGAIDSTECAARAVLGKIATIAQSTGNLSVAQAIRKELGGNTVQ